MNVSSHEGTTERAKTDPEILLNMNADDYEALCVVIFTEIVSSAQMMFRYKSTYKQLQLISIKALMRRI